MKEQKLYSAPLRIISYMPHVGSEGHCMKMALCRQISEIKTRKLEGNVARDVFDLTDMTKQTSLCIVSMTAS